MNNVTKAPKPEGFSHKIAHGKCKCLHTYLYDIIASKCILNSNFRYAQIIYVWLTTCENGEKVLKIEIWKTTFVEVKIENKKQQFQSISLCNNWSTNTYNNNDIHFLYNCWVSIPWRKEEIHRLEAEKICFLALELENRLFSNSRSGK